MEDEGSWERRSKLVSVPRGIGCWGNAEMVSDQETEAHCFLCVDVQRSGLDHTYHLTFGLSLWIALGGPCKVYI